MPRTGANYINPWRYADAGTVVDGAVDISLMTRLAPLLVSSAGSATYRLEFALDDGAVPRVNGRISARVEMICQRCLEPMVVEIASEVRLGLVRSRDDPGPDDAEPLVAENERLSLAALVEDELILALPPAPLHVSGACLPPAAPRAGPDPAAAGGGPFDALAALVSRGDPSDR
ncbi:MAG: YceD family protein [Gammaproteobacteria bacterium]|nr:YceD family protein [Gammaproteobacteria bacterium]